MTHRWIPVLVFMAAACGAEPTPAPNPAPPPFVDPDPRERRRTEIESEAARLGWKEFTQKTELVEELLRLYYDLSRDASVLGTIEETAILEKGIRLARASQSELARKVESVFAFRCRLYPFARMQAERIPNDAKGAEILAILQAWSQDEYERGGEVRVSDALQLVTYVAKREAPESALLFHQLYFVEEREGGVSLAFYTFASHRLETGRVHYLISHYANTMQIVAVYQDGAPTLGKVAGDLVAHAEQTLKQGKGD